MFTMKSMKLIALCASLILCLVGCSETSNEESSEVTTTEITTAVIAETTMSTEATTELTQPVEPYEIKNKLTQLEIQTNNPINLKQTSALYIDLDKIEKNIAKIPFNGVIYSFNFINDKLLVEIYPQGNNAIEELGIFDPYNNTYRKIGEIPFKASFGVYSFTLQDRYYIISNSTEENGKLIGNITMYNIENDELKNIDSFAENNIVQFVTPVDNNSIAYSYCEAGTQDWIVKYYDIDTDVSKEIFRHTNFNDNITSSPMSVASDGENIILVIQFIENGVYRTHLLWITSEGDWYKTEEIDLYKIYGNEYEITNFCISGEHYFFDVMLNSEKMPTILFRENDTFKPVETGPFWKQDLLSKSLADKSSIVFSQYNSYMRNMLYLVVINLNESIMVTYEYPFDEFENREYSIINEHGDLFVIYSGNNDGINYQLIKDFKSTDTPVRDYTLYVPQEGQANKYPYVIPE